VIDMFTADVNQFQCPPDRGMFRQQTVALDTGKKFRSPLTRSSVRAQGLGDKMAIALLGACRGAVACAHRSIAEAHARSELHMT
jgi:hypothetical protein